MLRLTYNTQELETCIIQVRENQKIGLVLGLLR